jgi:hypothetical protein
MVQIKKISQMYHYIEISNINSQVLLAKFTVPKSCNLY